MTEDDRREEKWRLKFEKRHEIQRNKTLGNNLCATITRKKHDMAKKYIQHKNQRKSHFFLHHDRKTKMCFLPGN